MKNHSILASKGFRKAWRRRNLENATFPVNEFPIDAVSVGKNTCGGLRVVGLSGRSKLEIGQYTYLASDVTFLCTDTVDGKKTEDIHIGDNVWIGAGTTILHGVTIGTGAVIGACSYVTEDVPPYGMVEGNPAKISYQQFDDAMVKRLLHAEKPLPQEVPSQEGVLAIVIAYRPNLGELAQNINCYITHISELIVWMNTLLTQAEQQTLLSQVHCPEKIRFLGTGSNQGISYPVNQAIRYARACGYPYLMTMDQDSTWVNFQDYIHEIPDFFAKHKEVKAMGPRIITDPEEAKTSSEKQFEKVAFVITSGAVYRVDLFDTIGLLDQKFFIDGVDEEICFRATAHGLDTAQNRNAFLLQQFGKKYRTAIGLEISSYNAFRYYHIVRNHLWLYAQPWMNRQGRWIIFRNYVMIIPPKVVMLEENRKEKIKAIFHGISDAVNCVFEEPK